MPSPNVNLTDQRPQKHTMIEWLRAAAKQGFDSIDRGEGIEFETTDDLEAYIHQIGNEVSAHIILSRDRF